MAVRVHLVCVCVRVYVRADMRRRRVVSSQKRTPLHMRSHWRKQHEPGVGVCVYVRADRGGGVQFFDDCGEGNSKRHQEST